ncbi:CAP domain-containing protein [Actinoplanes sp. NBC_00393]|uniref:CAP domain-containing protein n=1 Tax=Actinoplanes sp. NBC_00393 TaxID=2975953 RepID=UPI002E2423E8
MAATGAVVDEAPTGEPLLTEVEPSAGAPSPAASPSSQPSPSVTSATPRPTRTATKPSKRPSPTPAKTTKTATPTKSSTAATGESARVTEVIRLVNVERKAAGCGALTGEKRLHAAAQKHSDLQAEKNTMSHQLPGEASMGDRVTAEGYRWGGVAENVAAGYTTPAAVMDGWMNSPGHKANILNCGYKHIGVGVKKSSEGTLYWTQNFASPL